MSEEEKEDMYYESAHASIRNARERIKLGDVREAILHLADAIEHSTFGWAAGIDSIDVEDWPEIASETKRLPRVPDLRTLAIRNVNCVSALNEWAQQAGEDMPTYEYIGGGPFECICTFMGRDVQSAESHRTKNLSKHDAAERMLYTMRLAKNSGDKA